MKTRYRSALFCWLLACSFVLSAQAQPAADGLEGSDPFVPMFKPTLTITPTQGTIEIDGQLGDPGWRQASLANNFSETFPDDQTKPPIDIEAWVTYDDAHFYVAYIIKDDPSAIRANLSDRDQIWQDDYVGLLLDPNGDGQQVFFIAANPLGIQGDTRISTNGEDLTFDLVFESEGKITDSGYIVEMAIPFRSLRFPKADVQTWRMNHWITHPRDSRNTYSWAAISRDDACWPCQFGYVTGMRDVSSGKNLEIMPSVTGTQFGSLEGGDPELGFDNQRFNADPSLTVKYGLTSNLTTDITLNPDFSQIEADAAQIDVNSTFALFFEERRVFFQEGSDLFQTPITTVYTRSINNPDVASKLTGRFGKWNVAYIGARDANSPVLMPFEESSELVQGGRSISNILRFRRNAEDNSFIGAQITDRRLDAGGSGTTLGIDGTYRFADVYQVEGQFVGSHTGELNDAQLSEDNGLTGTFADGQYTVALDGESFWGHALYTSLERGGRHWVFDFDYWEYSPTFRAANGFETQNNSRSFIVFQGYNFYAENLDLVDRIRPMFNYRQQWNFDGVSKQESFGPSMFVQLKRQTHLWTGFSFENEQFNGVDFNDLWSWDFDMNSNFSEPLQLGMYFGIGRSIFRSSEPERGKSLNFSAWGTIRPTQRLSVRPMFNFSRLRDEVTDENFFSGYIVRTRVNYQISRRLFMRAIVQYNDFSERFEVDPLITYRLTPFSAFYLGSTHDFNTFTDPNRPDPTFIRQSQRQFFFKFQYQFRV